MKNYVFGLWNMILLIAGIVLTIAGYAIMRTGDKTVSVIILVITYLVIFPLSIMLGYKKQDKKEQD